MYAYLIYFDKMAFILFLRLLESDEQVILYDADSNHKYKCFVVRLHRVDGPAEIILSIKYNLSYYRNGIRLNDNDFYALRYKELLGTGEEIKFFTALFADR